MHRSRLSVLVIFAAVAACSTRDDSKGTDGLSQDPTLVARLEAGKQTRPQPLPDACGTVAVGAPPSSANQAQADELTRRAYDAEMQGNVQEARTLLRRASDLDATNKSAAYHLGLTSETLGDRTAAVTAYCRYLALAPTSAESAEARQRVAKLSQATTRVAAGSVSESASTSRRRASAATSRRVVRERRAAEPRVVVSAAPREADVSPAPSEPVIVSREAGGKSDGAAVEGEVIATSRPVPPCRAAAGRTTHGASRSEPRAERGDRRGRRSDHRRGDGTQREERDHRRRGRWDLRYGGGRYDSPVEWPHLIVGDEHTSALGDRRAVGTR